MGGCGKRPSRKQARRALVNKMVPLWPSTASFEHRLRRFLADKKGTKRRILERREYVFRRHVGNAAKYVLHSSVDVVNDRARSAKLLCDVSKQRLSRLWISHSQASSLMCSSTSFSASSSQYYGRQRQRACPRHRTNARSNADTGATANDQRHFCYSPVSLVIQVITQPAADVSRRAM